MSGAVVRPARQPERFGRLWLLPAYAALAMPGSHRARPGSARPDFQIWVGASTYGRAEETLRVALPRLLRHA
jgi:hypothetical protein